MTRPPKESNRGARREIFFLCVLCVLCGCLPAAAQGERATLTGTVVASMASVALRSTVDDTASLSVIVLP